MVLSAAAFVLPAGRFAVAVDTILSSADAYAAVKAAQGGDLVPAGTWLVVTFLDQHFPSVPWDALSP